MTSFFFQRRRELLVGSFFVAALFTIYFGVISDSPLPDHRLIVGFNDLVLHGLAFFVLSLLAFFIWGSSAYQIVVLGLAAIGLELVQIFEPARHADLVDVLASLGGVFVGLCVFKGLHFLIGLLPSRL